MNKNYESEMSMPSMDHVSCHASHPALSYNGLRAFHMLQQKCNFS